jgi:Mg-chelatase subunit ChlD
VLNRVVLSELREELRAMIRTHGDEHDGLVISWIGLSELMFLIAMTIMLVCGAMAVGHQQTSKKLVHTLSNQDALSKEHRAALLRVESLEHELTERQAELQALRDRAAELELALGSAESRATMTREQLLQSQQSLAAAMQQLTALERELEAADGRAVQLAAALQAKDLNLAGAEESLTAERAAAAKLKSEISELEKRLKAAADQEQQLRVAMEAGVDRERGLQQRVTELERRLEEWGRAANSLVALRGPLRKVVFVYDSSGSMANGDRFESSRALLCQWLSNLSMQQFAVLEFDDSVRSWHPTFEDSTESNRKAACDFLMQARADGLTRTDLALEATFKQYGDVDTVVLFTDGRMTDSAGQDVSEDRLDTLRKKLKDEHPHVVINTVGIGDYYTTTPDNANGGTSHSFGHFLSMLSVDHGGVFIGLGTRK